MGPIAFGETCCSQGSEQPCQPTLQSSEAHPASMVIQNRGMPLERVLCEVSHAPKHVHAHWHRHSCMHSDAHICLHTQVNMQCAHTPKLVPKCPQTLHAISFLCCMPLPRQCWPACLAGPAGCHGNTVLARRWSLLSYAAVRGQEQPGGMRSPCHPRLCQSSHIP